MIQTVTRWESHVVWEEVRYGFDKILRVLQDVEIPQPM